MQNIRWQLVPVLGSDLVLLPLPGKDLGVVYEARAAGHEWVVKLEHRTRHSMAKIHGLLARHSEIPAPRVHTCVDAGCSAWRIVVMEKCPGTPAHQLLATVGSGEQGRLLDVLVETLRRLQGIRFDVYGLFDENGSVFRSFGSRLEHLRAKEAHALARHEVRLRADGVVSQIFRSAAAAMVQLEAVPEQDAVLVHGDFKLTNVIVESISPPRLSIVDWEWARAYEAAFDCCSFLIKYHDAEHLCRGFWGRYLRETRIDPLLVACYLPIECFLHVDWALSQDRKPNLHVLRFARMLPNVDKVKSWLRGLSAEVSP